MLHHKQIKTILAISLLLLAVILQPAAIIPLTPGEQNAPDHETSLPALHSFIKAVSTDSPDQITGVYVDDQFALPVTEQPAAQPGYVSNRPDTVTQFGMAESYGTIGLLAHNYLAGEYFHDFTSGTEVIIIHGDGSIKRYIISSNTSYQALQPNSPHSSFKNLTTGELLSAADLFTEMYTQPGTITFQTCIASEGISSWGRLFVRAIPAEQYAASDVPSGSTIRQ